MDILPTNLPGLEVNELQPHFDVLEWPLDDYTPVEV